MPARQRLRLAQGVRGDVPLVRRRFAWAALAVAVLAGCSGAAVVPPAVTLDAYYTQHLNWKPCDNGFYCATLEVPFDYGRPGWRHFTLPVVKLPASIPSKRRGSLIINPGGPGGSGVQFALGARSEFSTVVLDEYDIVGFDPRGVGGSVPALRCMSGPALDKYFSTDDSGADLPALEAENRLYAQSCARSDLLPYIGTRNAARDMDVLRAALGSPRLTYLGKSYGTYLGTWYASLYPSKVGRLVLDGAVDPSVSGMAMDITQAEGFETAFGQFASWCAASPGCPLGPRPVPAVRRLLSSSLRNDLGDGQVADGALLLNGIASGLYSKSFWPALRTGLADAFRGDGTVLVELANALMERSANGTYSNLADVDTAVNCLDRPWPRSLSSWRAAARLASRAAPLFGAPLVWGSLACAYWPVRSYPLPSASSMRAPGAPPILVVGDLRDPATPYRWAQALASSLSSGVLLGWRGEGHTSYFEGSPCVDGYVNTYLLTGTVPPTGTICP
jgi:pimeloyl-ACP methyl ester carboxylesterase